ncbi:MAG: hypothetical protein RI897_1484 [Verrucomicrobiota bacterium]
MEVGDLVFRGDLNQMGIITDVVEEALVGVDDSFGLAGGT